MGFARFVVSLLVLLRQTFIFILFDSAEPAFSLLHFFIFSETGHTEDVASSLLPLLLVIYHHPPVLSFLQSLVLLVNIRLLTKHLFSKCLLSMRFPSALKE